MLNIRIKELDEKRINSKIIVSLAASNVGNKRSSWTRHFGINLKETNEIIRPYQGLLIGLISIKNLTGDLEIYSNNIKSDDLRDDLDKHSMFRLLKNKILDLMVNFDNVSVKEEEFQAISESDDKISGILSLNVGFYDSGSVRI